MSLRRRRSQSKKGKPEAGTPQLKKVASYQEDHEGKKLRSARTVYSLWSSAKYVLILSLLLWWLPMFGQMIAGYVGGRKAGGPWRGVIASILPVLGIFAIISAFESGVLPDEVFGVGIRPSALLGGLATSIPFLGPYFEFTQEYVSQFVSALAGSSPYGINSYVLTVAFAYIGGIIAEQNRREIEFTRGASTSHTTILVAPDQLQGQAGGTTQLPAAGAVVPQQGVGLLPHDHHIMQNDRSLSRAIMRFFNHQQHGHRKARSFEKFDQLVAANSPEAICGTDDAVEMDERTIRRRRAAKKGSKRTREERSRWRSKKARARREEIVERKRATPKVKKKKAPAVQRARTKSTRKRAREKPVAMPKAERRQHPSSNSSLRVDPRKPKTLRRVHKYIEDEWNPKSRKVKHPGPAPHPRKMVRGIRTASSDERRGKSANFAKPNKRFARRSWDTM